LSNNHYFLTKRTKETIIATALVIIAITAILYSTVIQPQLARNNKQTLIQEKIDFLKSHGYNVFLTDVNYSALSRNSVRYKSFDEWYNELTILNTPHENWIGIAYISCYRTPPTVLHFGFNLSLSTGLQLNTLTTS